MCPRDTTRPDPADPVAGPADRVQADHRRAQGDLAADVDDVRPVGGEGGIDLGDRRPDPVRREIVRSEPSASTTYTPLDELRAAAENTIRSPSGENEPYEKHPNPGVVRGVSWDPSASMMYRPHRHLSCTREKTILEPSGENAGEKSPPDPWTVASGWTRRRDASAG